MVTQEVTEHTLADTIVHEPTRILMITIHIRALPTVMAMDIIHRITQDITVPARTGTHHQHMIAGTMMSMIII